MELPKESSRDVQHEETNQVTESLRKQAILDSVKPTTVASCTVHAYAPNGMKPAEKAQEGNELS